MPANTIAKMLEIMDMLKRQGLLTASADEISRAISICAGSRDETKQRYWKEMKLFKLLTHEQDSEWKLHYDEAARLVFR